MAKKLITIALSCTLAGCANPNAMQAAMVQQGQPPEYATGYQDGCHSGYQAAGSWQHRFTKDAARFQADKLYADGWADGFNVCKGKQESIDRLLGPVF